MINNQSLMQLTMTCIVQMIYIVYDDTLYKFFKIIILIHRIFLKFFFLKIVNK